MLKMQKTKKVPSISKHELIILGKANPKKINFLKTLRIKKKTNNASAKPPS